MKERIFALHGDILWSASPDRLCTEENAYVICEDGLCAGVFRSLPEKYSAVPVREAPGCLILPGLVDLHLHAPQYPFRGTGMDLELLPWLEQYAFPEETRYASLPYAEAAYRRFVRDLVKSPTTRCCIMATRHAAATILLMEMLEKTGLISYVGKVNMDRSAPDPLRERTAAESAADTEKWLADTAGRFQCVFPILTPRFIPACTDELMELLSGIQKKWKLPVQSHLSENPKEVELVRSLCPWSSCYGDAYDHFGLFGTSGEGALMAHCVYSDDTELALMKKRGTFAVHCPESNANLASGIAPVRRFLEEGILCGLGTDVAGGSSLSLFRAMQQTIQFSKLRFRLQDPSLAPVTAAEAFYLGTAGGGRFFGKTGSFEPGFEFDAVIIDDSTLCEGQCPDPAQRLERIIYLFESGMLKGKYVRGKKLF